jgi:hypothetical protein
MCVRCAGGRILAAVRPRRLHLAGALPVSNMGVCHRFWGHRTIGHF